MFSMQNSCLTGIVHVLQHITTTSCNEFAAVTFDVADDEGCTSKALQAAAAV